jgi:hypothetical protein
MLELLEGLRRERRLSVRYFVFALLIVFLVQWFLVPAMPTPPPIPGDPGIAVDE